MAGNKTKRRPAVEWYLEGKKRPFAYSTVAESDSIAILLQDYGDLLSVLQANNNSNIVLTHNELFIINTFVENKEYKPELRY